MQNKPTIFSLGLVALKRSSSQERSVTLSVTGEEKKKEKGKTDDDRVGSHWVRSKPSASSQSRDTKSYIKPCTHA